MKTFLKNKAGATSIEYGLIAALICMVIVGAMGGVGDQLGPLFDSVSNGFTNP